MADPSGERRLRVLVVDDDEAIRTALRDLLEHAGFEVRTAGDGHAALDVLVGERFRPGAILLDAAMPGMDGDTFIQALAQVADSESIGVVCMSALPHVPEALCARSAAVLRKPFEASHLLTAIRSSVRRP